MMLGESGLKEASGALENRLKTDFFFEGEAGGLEDSE